MKKRVIAFVACFLILASVLCVSVFAQGLNDPSKYALGGFLYDSQNYFPQLAEFTSNGPYMRLNNGFFFVGNDLNNLSQVGYDWNWDYTLWRFNDSVQYWSIIDKNALNPEGHEHYRVYFDSAQNIFVAVSRPSGNVVASGRYLLVVPRISYDVNTSYYSAGKNQINYEFLFATNSVQYVNDILTSASYENGYRAGESNAAELAEVIPSLAYSVVEAPVNVFTSMLDFEIWGFSVKNLALGILSIAVVGAIVVFIAKVK